VGAKLRNFLVATRIALDQSSATSPLFFDSLYFGQIAKRVTFDDGMDKYRYTPAEINDLIKARGADAVYAFQVRNPLHNGHVLLLKDTREQLIKQGYKNPILLLHPLGGWCKDDDVPLGPRIHQH
jgi:3'-phosphoadenosine 5'-phosphosulfate synthase